MVGGHPGFVRHGLCQLGRPTAGRSVRVPPWRMWAAGLDTSPSTCMAASGETPTSRAGGCCTGSCLRWCGTRSVGGRERVAGTGCRQGMGERIAEPGGPGTRTSPSTTAWICSTSRSPNTCGDSTRLSAMTVVDTCGPSRRWGSRRPEVPPTGFASLPFGWFWPGEVLGRVPDASPGWHAERPSARALPGRSRRGPAARDDCRDVEVQPVPFHGSRLHHLSARFEVGRSPGRVDDPSTESWVLRCVAR